jgi:predicted RNA-binding Zn-ribbon protein involved in translation (DUF1610 family)
MRTCQHCGGPLKRDGRYCSYACKYEASKRSVSLVCPNCGKTFSVRPSELRPGRNSAIFCTRHCALRWSEERVRSLRAEGKPLIVVDKDAITCSVCGEVLKTIGAHFLRHGLSTRNMGHLERNLLMGLECGARCVPEKIRERMRENADIRNFGDRRRKGGPDNGWERVALLRALVPLPRPTREKISMTCIKNAWSQHVAACTTRTCGFCGNGFKVNRGNPRVRCPDCVKARLVIPRSGKPCPRGRFTTLAERKNLVWELRQRGLTRRQIAENLHISTRQAQRDLRRAGGQEGGLQ